MPEISTPAETAMGVEQVTVKKLWELPAGVALEPSSVDATSEALTLNVFVWLTLKRPPHVTRCLFEKMEAVGFTAVELAGSYPNPSDCSRRFQNWIVARLAERACAPTA